MKMKNKLVDKGVSNGVSNLLEVYKKLPIEVESALGKYLWDKNGKRYTDFFSGLAVSNLGHRPECVMDAINNAVSKYLHLSNLFPEKFQGELADELIKRSFPGKVFFSNSGAEANETAIKTARKYFNGEKYEIITFTNSFHGRTLATLAATGQSKFKEGFGPMPDGFVHAEYNFLASVEDKINYKTCAVMVETIQSEGGVVVAHREFISGLRKISDDSNMLLIIDEIQTGIGRTGKFFGYEYYGIQPDIITLGKALGGGLPLAATIIKNDVAKCMTKGDHGSTFGGNPISCAASLATVKNIDDKLIHDVMNKGKYLIGLLKELAKKYNDDINEVRGRGLMVGMELSFEGKDLISYLLEKGYILNCTQDKVIRFLPPFIIEKEDMDKLVELIDEYLKERL